MGTLEEKEPMLILIPREAVESVDTNGVVMGLNVFAKGKTTSMAAQGNVQLVFDGFTEDSRELWEIDAVRHYVSILDREAPFWFFLADLRSETLFVVAACLSRVTEVKPGQSTFHPDDLESFVRRQSSILVELWREHGLPSGQDAQRAMDINAYFQSRQIWN